MELEVREEDSWPGTRWVTSLFDRTHVQEVQHSVPLLVVRSATGQHEDDLIVPVGP